MPIPNGPLYSCSSLRLKLPSSISKPLKTLQGWVILEPIELKPIDELKFIEEKDNFKENLLANRKEEEFNKYFQDLQKKAGFVSYTAKQ